MSHAFVFIEYENTVEPRYKEVPRDWQNLFAITRFRYIEVLFHRFLITITGVKKIVR